MKLAAAEKTNEIFESLARESTLSARVMEQMENLIVSRHLQPGDRLPNWRASSA
jgi:DNA-binding FadR family transcriptional regulator